MKKLSLYLPALIAFLFISLTVVFAESSDLGMQENIQSSPPGITSFSPTFGPVGSNVTIKGANFNAAVAKNTVYFGPVKAIVESATSTSLLVTVPPGAAYAPLSVTTDSMTVNSAMPFTPTFPSRRVIDRQAFATKVDFKVWGSIGSMAAADMDSDGKIDLITTSNMGVTVFRNKSQGAGIDSTLFVDRVDLPSLTGSDWVTAIVVDDLNGDGKLDVVTVLRSSNSIAVFLNTSSPGAISFGARTDFAVGNMPQEAAVGDLDGDGKQDVVVTNSAGGWGTTISVLRNITVGQTINFEMSFELFSGNAPYGVSLRDIDGDLRSDIVVANRNDAFISIFRNVSTKGSLGPGSFEAKVDFPLPEGGGAYHVVPCDLDSDGKIDLALAQGGSGNTILSLLRNTSTSGHLSFDPQIVISVPKDSRDVMAGDLDGDGKCDLASCSWEEHSMSVMRNMSETGGMTAQPFPERTDFTAGKNPTAILLADFDLDGQPDIAAGNFNNGTISVLRNVIAPPATGVAASSRAVEVKEFRLLHNYPNPFNLTTRIAFEISTPGAVALRVFDINGHLVKTLVVGHKEAGWYEAAWHGRDDSGREVPSGIYFFRLDADEFSQTCKALLLK
jgi:hypothetical protein